MELAPCIHDRKGGPHAREPDAIPAMTSQPEQTAPHTRLTPWGELPPARQLELRVAYGHYLDTLPPTCSMEEKNRRFARWLAQRGVAFP